MPTGKSMDGINKASGKPKPDLRPDHDLPAPEPMPLLEPSDEKAIEAISDDNSKESLASFPKKKRLWLKLIGGILLFVIVAASVAGYLWYAGKLGPASDDTTKHVRMVIELGSSPNMIAEELESKEVIQSSVAFMLYVKLTGNEGKLRAGAYNLQPSLSTPAIVDHLVSGKQDTFRVTFLPGDTLENNRKVLMNLKLYSEAEIDEALAKQYDHALFKDKPAGADLEGYIFGETYEFDASATPETILIRTFDQFQAYIAENNLIAKFKKQGLDLYEAITLASIVQREVTNSKDQMKVARVFLNRMELGMNLGSDVTYQYAADKLGVERTPLLDSPYNTRKYAGLPPGPIAVPGTGALDAIASPAKNDFLFFLSGDDGKTYFAVTEEQHEQNKTLHCKKKCLIL